MSDAVSPATAVPPATGAKRTLSKAARSRIRKAAIAYLTHASAIITESRLIDVSRHQKAGPWLEWLALRSVLGEESGSTLTAALVRDIRGMTTDHVAGTWQRANEYPLALLRAFLALSILDAELEQWG